MLAPALLPMALLLLALQTGRFRMLSKDKAHPYGKREPGPTARGEGRQADPRAQARPLPKTPGLAAPSAAEAEASAAALPAAAHPPTQPQIHPPDHQDPPAAPEPALPAPRQAPLTMTE